MENCNLAINAAKDVGCRVTNIGPRDIMTARPHLVLGRVETNPCVGSTRPFFTTSFLGDGAAVLAPRAARNRHRHAIEQASRRWRGGRRGDSARTRRKSLRATQVLGLLWQAIRLLLTQKISLKEHPGLVALLEGDETLQQLLACLLYTSPSPRD